MIRESSISVTSWIHEIHPTSKIICTALYVSFVALSFRITTLSIALIISILVLLLSNLNYKLFFKKIFVLLSFLIALWVGLSLSFNFEGIIGIDFTQSRNLLALQITLRSISISLFFICFIATMSPNILADSLNNIYFPKKMIYLFLITYRYLFILEEEYNKLICAIKLRNFHSGINFHTYKTYSYLLGMLFVRAYDRANRVHYAMICRNFNGNFFIIKKHNLNWQTFVFVIFNILLLMVLLIFEIKN